VTVQETRSRRDAKRFRRRLALVAAFVAIFVVAIVWLAMSLFT
jgi:hypothetical protein